MKANLENLAEAEEIANSAMKVLTFEKELDPEFNYSSLPFCVVDSVFSIGVRYEAVRKVVTTIATRLNLPKYSKGNKSGKVTEITTSDFIDTLKKYNQENNSINYFNNRQRTSTINGILKADAVLQFLDVLKKYKVEDFENVTSVLNNEAFEKEILAIKGQSSGISLKYFLMLAGNEDLIKPDRMIQRFLQKIISREPSFGECQDLLEKSSKIISDKLGRKITPLIFDNLIWNYQRSIPKNKRR